MGYTTGLTDDEFDELLVRLREEGVEGYPPILGLSGSLRATLIHLRHNIVQAAIGELLGVSQPTISRAVKALTEAFPRVLESLLLTAEEVPWGCDAGPRRREAAVRAAPLGGRRARPPDPAGPGGRARSDAHSPSAASTTFLASSWTTARFSAPLKDSA